MLIEGWSLLWFICRIAATVSTAGADQQVWPSIDLGALTFSLYAWAPKTSLMARTSEMSPSGVEVASGRHGVLDALTVQHNQIFAIELPAAVGLGVGLLQIDPFSGVSSRLMTLPAAVESVAPGR